MQQRLEWCSLFGAAKHLKQQELMDIQATAAAVRRFPHAGGGLGPDYLLQFMKPRTISENTMRRGFSPELV